MLIRPELIDRLAEILEGIPIAGPPSLKATGSLPREASEPHGSPLREASVLVYHSGRPADGGGPLAGESPLLEINLTESDSEVSMLVNSALGMVEMHRIDEVRLLEATAEAAFYCREIPDRLSVLTLSSHGVIQVYMNIDEKLGTLDLSEIADHDLRAAVALKIFSENAEVFGDATTA
jgi:hypothetical protein